MGGPRSERVKAILALGKSKVRLDDLRDIFVGQANRNIRMTYIRMVKAHPELPELLLPIRGRPVGSQNKKSRAAYMDNEASMPQKVGATADLYSSGLQVASVEELPSGEILYRLK